jgi:hypothetical protein
VHRIGLGPCAAPFPAEQHCRPALSPLVEGAARRGPLPRCCFRLIARVRAAQNGLLVSMQLDTPLAVFAAAPARYSYRLVAGVPVVDPPRRTPRTIGRRGPGRDRRRRQCPLWKSGTDASAPAMRDACTRPERAIAATRSSAAGAPRSTTPCAGCPGRCGASGSRSSTGIAERGARPTIAQPARANRREDERPTEPRPDDGVSAGPSRYPLARVGRVPGARLAADSVTKLDEANGRLTSAVRGYRGSRPMISRISSALQARNVLVRRLPSRTTARV